MRLLDEEFRLLRVSVEASLDMKGSALLVTSAEERDGTSYVACGIARACAEAGYATVLVDGRGDRGQVAEQLGIAQPVREALDGRVCVQSTETDLCAAFLAGASGRTSVSLPALRNSMAALKERFDVVVIDGAPAPKSNVAMQLANVADAVLLTVRVGRRPCLGDDRLKSLLAAMKSHVLGVVATAGDQRHATTSAPAPVAHVDAIATGRARAVRA
jgi:Mrp family chromosome partitioning ATPase